MTATVTPTTRFRFRLFIAAGTPNSIQAQANLNALCQSRFPDDFDIEVIDVFMNPERALAEGIFMTPMLIVLDPTPEKRLAGTLGNTGVLADALGLAREAR